MLRFLVSIVCVLSLSGCPDDEVTNDPATDTGNVSIFVPQDGVEATRDSGSGLHTTKSELRFFDADGLEWLAPAGTVTDGASIPQFALSLTGNQLDNRFFKAAVVHDAYCAADNEGGDSYHTRSWQQVHRMFYEACIVGKTPHLLAKLMFAAVWLGGPTWPFPDDAVVATRLPVPDANLLQEFQWCSKWVEEADPSIDRITSWMDTRHDVLQAAAREGSIVEVTPAFSPIDSTWSEATMLDVAPPVWIQVQTLLAERCLKCHSGEAARADLSNMEFDVDDPEIREEWVQSGEVIEGIMEHPPFETELTEEERVAFSTWLDEKLSR